MTTYSRPLLIVGALCGAAGVALAARGSHAGDANLSIAANFLIIHAPALIAIAALPLGRWSRCAGWVLFVGLAVFAGDLIARSQWGNALFPMAAPIGGGGMIAGWLAVAVCGLFNRDSSQPSV